MTYDIFQDAHNFGVKSVSQLCNCLKINYGMNLPEYDQTSICQGKVVAKDSNASKQLYLIQKKKP